MALLRNIAGLVRADLINTDQSIYQGPNVSFPDRPNFEEIPPTVSQPLFPITTDPSTPITYDPGIPISYTPDTSTYPGLPETVATDSTTTDMRDVLTPSNPQPLPPKITDTIADTPADTPATP